MNRRNFLVRSVMVAGSTMLPLAARSEKPRNEFVVGQSVDLSGPLQNIGRDYFTGAKVAFDQANASGGTVGRKWRYIQLDDGAVPERAVANVSRLLDDRQADFLFGFTGDECVKAVLDAPAFRASGRLLFAPVSGVDPRKSDGRVLYTRATYAEEIAAMFGQFASGRMSTFVFVHTSSPTGIAARDAALNLLRQRNIPLPALRQIREDGSDATTLAVSIASTSPHAVVILADTVTTALLARQLRPRLPGTFIGLTSSADAAAVQQILGPALAFGLVVTRVVPNPTTGTERIVREFSRVLAKYMDEAASTASLEGYIGARALIEMTRKTGGTFGTPASLQFSKTLDLGDWVLNFRTGERASHYVDTSMITRKGALLG